MRKRGMDRVTANKEKDVLYVQTFGGFSMTYKGKLITGSARSRESQFVYLMQVLLHERANGVSRDRLEEVLFGDRDIEDVRHAIRSVIYNAKKKLRECGLPEVAYIVQRDGIYYWTEEIPVKEDAHEFEALYRKAASEENPDARVDRYLDACYCCTGEFLPFHAGILWVAQEARRYRSIFYACVKKTVRLLREEQDFLQMEKLGLYAAKVSPLSDWEAVTMEALVSQGRYEDARQFYDATVELYFQEQGLRPSAQMMELFRKLESEMEQQYEVLDDIQTRLSETKEEAPGGYLCSYLVFQGIYRMMRRIMERGGQSIYLMLCVVADERGKEIRDAQVLERLSGSLGEVICGSVRRSDTVSRYGRGQYLVLLVNTTFEDCSIIQDRISRRFAEEWKHTEVQYYVNSVICFPGRDGSFLDQGE